ncbi:MAG: multicopper oxidase family protein [Syntrophorhabdaceae bacterium]
MTGRLRLLFILVAALTILGSPVLVTASALVPQTAINGDNFFNTYGFTQPLAVFGPGYNAALPRVDAKCHPYLRITMKEIEQQVLPAPAFGKTRLWAYETRDGYTGQLLGPAHWPGVTLEAQRYLPNIIKYVNKLPSFRKDNPFGPGLVQGLVSVDKTIHWADPLNRGMMNHCMMDPMMPECQEPFIGPVPAVPHMHGQETHSNYDGGPEQWWTPNGIRGKDYRSAWPTDPNAAIYKYINAQEPGTMWFHDHALGITRTNVYSGLAAFYLLKDATREPYNLPKKAYDIELAIQDRQFDTTGQLYFPDGSGDCGSGSPTDPCLMGGPPNPDIHPFWIPEFFGDIAIVNGTPWPVFDVEPRRYLFRVNDGSNARFYRLTVGDTAAGEPNPPVYQIGKDDNYLNSPVKISDIFLGPGERAYVIIDFTGLAGQTITVKNDAPVPFPDGLVPGVDTNQINMDKIMRFRVNVPLKSTDYSCNPALNQCKRPYPIKRLTDGNGNLAPYVKIHKKRQLILKEFMGDGGPIEVLVNNTKWDGLKSPSIATIFPTDGVSETPRVGSTELWEIINLTMDAHPMHTHLTQFQILNRQEFDMMDGMGYQDAAWIPAFGTGPAPLLPGCNPGEFCPGYGPPLPYNQPNADGALGGNPAISPYLIGDPILPRPEEKGWHDTAKAFPGQVLRILVRFAPTSTPVTYAYPGANYFPFDPSAGPGYVWHCHIIDHEDNEMMRPFKVKR